MIDCGLGYRTPRGCLVVYHGGEDEMKMWMDKLTALDWTIESLFRYYDEGFDPYYIPVKEPSLFG